MIADQQWFWITLLNLQRQWSNDRSVLDLIPAAQRDFERRAAWPAPRAVSYFLNNLEVIRETYLHLEAGEIPDPELLNLLLGDVQLRLVPWANAAAVRESARRKAAAGGRLEILQVTQDRRNFNPGTRFLRATIHRAAYYFSQYVDERLSDPFWPAVAPDRHSVRENPPGSGDLALFLPVGAGPGTTA